MVQALSAGVSFRHAERAGALAEGRVLVLDAFDAQLRVAADVGASFQVLLESRSEPLPPLRSGVRARLAEPPAFERDAPPAELFFAAIASVAPPPHERLSGPVARARSYIDEHLAHDFDLETLGTAVGIERCYLCRLFQQQIGLPPHRFRTHLRVARARELLAEGLHCTKVAYAVGFCDQSHLNRCFKELTGTTPGAYAKACSASAPGWMTSAAA